MSDEEKKDEEPTKPKPEWVHKKEFRIVGELRNVVGLAKDASEKEVAALRRKLDRLTYGS